MTQGINQFLNNVDLTSFGCPCHYNMIGYSHEKCIESSSCCKSCWTLAFVRGYNEDGSLEKVGDVEE